MKNVILFALCCLFFVSCGHHRDGSSVWAVGLWILPWGTGLAAGWCWYRAISVRNRGAEVWDGRKYIHSPGKVPITSIGVFWYAVVLTVACIGIIIAVNWEKG
jgi:hypothetical protein